MQLVNVNLTTKLKNFQGAHKTCRLGGPNPNNTFCLNTGWLVEVHQPMLIYDFRLRTVL